MQPPLSLLLRIMVSTLISVSTIGQAIARDDVAVVVATSDGEKVTGVLEGIEPTQIRVATESGVRTLGVESVRRVECIRSEPDADGEITIFGTDGARLTGTDVEWEGDVVSLTVPEGVLTMPVTGVEVIEWNRTRREQGDTAPGWRDSLPDAVCAVRDRRDHQRRGEDPARRRRHFGQAGSRCWSTISSGTDGSWWDSCHGSGGATAGNPG